MILINLLPHRQATRVRRKRAFQRALCLSVLAGVLVAGSAYGWLKLRIKAQYGRNAYLQSEVADLDVQIKEVRRLHAEIEVLQKKQQAMEQLLVQRNLTVHLFNILTRQLPEGVYFNAVRQSGFVVELQGQAISSDKVSELLSALSVSASWLTDTQLKEIKSGTVELPARGVHKVVNFRLAFTLGSGNANADGEGEAVPLLSDVPWLPAISSSRYDA